MQDKPRVGISSCLLGHRVRYEGGHKREPLLKMVGKFVEWIPVARNSRSAWECRASRFASKRAPKVSA